jgi:hypothetical protein
LNELVAADPSNMLYRREYRDREFMLAQSLSYSGQAQKALEMMHSLESGYDLAPEGRTPDAGIGDEDIQFLLALADIQSLAGDDSGARNSLNHLREIWLAHGPAMGEAWVMEMRWIEFRYQYWRGFGEVLERDWPENPRSGLGLAREFRSCHENEMVAKDAVVSGESGEAGDVVEYLLSRGYRAPSFLSFCAENDLCDR